MNSKSPTFIFSAISSAVNRIISQKFPKITAMMKPDIGTEMSKQNPTYSWLNLKMDALLTQQKDQNGEVIYKLNREAFKTSVKLPVAYIEKENVKQAMKRLKKLTPDLMKLSQLKPSGSHKCVLLDPDKLANRDNVISENDWLTVQQMITNVNHSDESELLAACEQVDIDYHNYTLDTVFNLVLPPEMQVSGYSVIGHIVHFNMKQEVLPYRFLIGEVILDKISTARTVVNKTSTIDNTYRTFGIELIAGEPNYITTVKEHYCTFTLNFAKVYWNSRLSNEHNFVASQFRENDVMYDVFAGVGPFAIPAAKCKTRIVANDLNPDSFHWLKENIKSNQSKRKGALGQLNVAAHNLDGREFIKKIALPDYLAECKKSTFNPQSRFFVIMNLPGLAVEFLDAFASFMTDESALSGQDGDHYSIAEHLSDKLADYPLNIFCYFFLKSNLEESNAKNTTHHTSYKDLDVIREEICNRLGLSVSHSLRRKSTNEEDSQSIHFRLVRNVAPGKDMFCAQFRYNILHSLSSHDEDKNSVELSQPKRARMDL